MTNSSFPDNEGARIMRFKVRIKEVPLYIPEIADHGNFPSITSSLDRGLSVRSKSVKTALYSMMYSAIFFLSDATALRNDVLCLLVAIHIHTEHVTGIKYSSLIFLSCSKKKRYYSQSPAVSLFSYYQMSEISLHIAIVV